LDSDAEGDVHKYPIGQHKDKPYGRASAHWSETTTTRISYSKYLSTNVTCFPNEDAELGHLARKSCPVHARVVKSLRRSGKVVTWGKSPVYLLTGDNTRNVDHISYRRSRFYDQPSMVSRTLRLLEGGHF
jgi:hypothetical protein